MEEKVAEAEFGRWCSLSEHTVG